MVVIMVIEMVVGMMMVLEVCIMLLSMVVKL